MFVEPLDIPITADTPDVVIAPIVLPEVVKILPDVVILFVPKRIPVIAAPPVILVIVFEAVSVLIPLKLTLIIVMAPVGVALAVMLLKILLVIVFVGPPPSVFDHPAIAVLPGTVIFEKLFPVLFIYEKAAEEAFAPKNVTVPPAPPLLNAVTTELLFTFSTPPATILDARVINVTEPVVFTFRLVNVLLLILSVFPFAWLQLI